MIKAPFTFRRNEQNLTFEVLDAQKIVVAQIDSAMPEPCQQASVRAITNALNAYTGQKAGVQ